MKCFYMNYTEKFGEWRLVQQRIERWYQSVFSRKIGLRLCDIRRSWSSSPWNVTYALTTVASCHTLIYSIRVSQGSVATRLKFGGISKQVSLQIVYGVCQWMKEL